LALPGSLLVAFENQDRGTPPQAGIGFQLLGSADGQPRWEQALVLRPGEPGVSFSRPLAVSDAEGGMLALYEVRVEQDADLVAVHVSATGQAGAHQAVELVPLAHSPAAEGGAVLSPDGQGGAYLVFLHQVILPEGPAAPRIAAQHLWADGSVSWGSDPLGYLLLSPAGELASAPALVPDGRGGIIVAWLSVPFDAPDTAARIFGQHVSAGGELLWGQPRLLASAMGTLGEPVLVPDGSGGALLLFTEKDVQGEVSGDTDIMVQKIGVDGSFPWSGTAKDYKIVSATQLAERALVAIPDGNGGAIAAFEALWLEGEREGDVDIMAQRIDTDGLGRWSDGAPVAVTHSGWSEEAPVLVADGSGGAVAVFEIHPPPEHLSEDVDLAAQRLSASGSLLWHEGLRSAAVSSSGHAERRPAVLADGTGGAVVVFEAVSRSGEHAGDIELATQRLARDGAPGWGEDGSPVLIATTEDQEQRPALGLRR